jgi:hypothetical protein
VTVRDPVEVAPRGSPDERCEAVLSRVEEFGDDPIDDA